jgi:hypothetical protein
LALQNNRKASLYRTWHATQSRNIHAALLQHQQRALTEIVVANARLKTHAAA